MFHNEDYLRSRRSVGLCQVPACGSNYAFISDEGYIDLIGERRYRECRYRPKFDKLPLLQIKHSDLSIDYGLYCRRFIDNTMHRLRYSEKTLQRAGSKFAEAQSDLQRAVSRRDLIYSQMNRDRNTDYQHYDLHKADLKVEQLKELTESAEREVKSIRFQMGIFEGLPKQPIRASGIYIRTLGQL